MTQNKSEITDSAAIASPQMSELLHAAYSWWKGRRPSDWGEKEHMSNPTVNTVTEAEETLAKEVARQIQLLK